MAVHPRLMPALAAAMLVLALLSPSVAFKDNEMKRCEQLHFCRSNRERPAEQYTLPAGLKQSGKSLAGSVVHAATGAAFDLSLAAYDDGAVRVRVTEPGKRRFEVPDVLLDTVAQRQVEWAMTKPDANTLHLRAGATTVLVRLSPFAVELVDGTEKLLTLNERELFNIEPLGEKKEGAPDGAWEESYNSHKDSKPKGPQSLSLDLRFHSSPHVFGIPEHASSFALKTTKNVDGSIVTDPYRLYNLDVYEYVHDSPFGLYGSIPFLLGHSTGGGARAPRTVGAFWLNAAEMYVDVTADNGSTDAHWFAESGIVDLFLLPGPTAADVWRSYAALTGMPSLPPLFSIAYHQCRWNYNNEADVTAVNTGFDDNDIPYDVLWLDIEHTDAKKYMTWDSRYFPTPVRMQEEIGSFGRKMVTIIDPHVKRDPNYEMHNEATKMGYYVKNAAGTGDFEGWCWPGSSSYLDVTNPSIRDWWATQFSLDKYKGSTEILHVWNDMNEPSVFNGPEVTMQKDLMHHGGWEHRDVHNVYGMFYHMATVNGLARRSPQQRPFVLSRSFYAGSQRWGAVWTGDNAAEWSHLRVSIPMLLSMGVAGLPFVGADVGGFFGNPDGELMTRWYQIGAFYPFFRGHAHHDTKRREPWLFGEPYTASIRAAIRSRYAMLPYIYTVFAENSRTGTPVARPLWSEFPADAAALTVDDAMMVGSALLVCPVLEAGQAERSCYLPGGAGTVWYNAATGTRHAGGQTVTLAVTLEDVPLFIRGGSIIPRKERARRSSAAMADDPYTLIVAPDSNGRAEGEIYLDDGSSYAFQTGAFQRQRFVLADGQLRASRVEGDGFATEAVVERVVVLGQQGAALPKVETAGAQLAVQTGPVFASHAGAGGGAAALVVRKPQLPVAGEWAISFGGKLQTA